MWSDGEQMRRGQPAWGRLPEPSLVCTVTASLSRWYKGTVRSTCRLPLEQRDSQGPKGAGPPLHLAAQEWGCRPSHLASFCPEAILLLTFSPGSERNSGRSQKPPLLKENWYRILSTLCDHAHRPAPLHVSACTRVFMTSWSWMSVLWVGREICAHQKSSVEREEA